MQAKYEAAQRLAIESRKPLLVYGHTVTCPGCLYFEEQLTSDQELQTNLNKVVLCELDEDTTEGRSILDQYAKLGSPLFVLHDKHNKAGFSWIGYKRQQFTHIIDAFVAGLDPIDALIASFNATPSESMAEKVGELALFSGHYQLAQAYYAKAFALNPRALYRSRELSALGSLVYAGEAESDHFLAEIEATLKTELFDAKNRIYWLIRDHWSVARDQRKQIMARYWRYLDGIEQPKDETWYALRWHFLRATEAWYSHKNFPEVRAHLEAIMALGPAEEHSSRQRFGLTVLYEAGVANQQALGFARSKLWDPDDKASPYFSSARKHMVWLECAVKPSSCASFLQRTRPEESSEWLNNDAWLLFEAEIASEQALGWAKAAVEAASDDDIRSAALDTLAELHFARGEKQAAVNAIEAALAANPSNAHYAAQLKRFKAEAP